jgi:uncharacterized surface protein with fasciclin (FAS1) repeats
MKAVTVLACVGAIATSTAAAPSPAPSAPAQSTQIPTIASFVAASGSGFDNNPFDFDLLLKAAQTADLVGALANPEARLTLFAPNDAAFIRLARDLGFAGTSESGAWDFLVDALTQLGNGNPIPVLQQVLLYHVAPVRINAIQFILLGLTNQVITTLQGGTVKPVGLRLIDNEPDLANPTLFVPLNVWTGNGTVHTISRVLLPIDLP